MASVGLPCCPRPTAPLATQAWSCRPSKGPQRALLAQGEGRESETVCKEVIFSLVTGLGAATSVLHFRFCFFLCPV